jgi:hypothetical protein
MIAFHPFLVLMFVMNSYMHGNLQNHISRLQNEPEPVPDLDFTPGTPRVIRLSFSTFHSNTSAFSILIEPSCKIWAVLFYMIQSMREAAEIVAAVPDLGFCAEDARAIGLSLFIART